MTYTRTYTVSQTDDTWLLTCYAKRVVEDVGYPVTVDDSDSNDPGLHPISISSIAYTLFVMMASAHTLCFREKHRKEQEKSKSPCTCQRFLMDIDSLAKGLVMWYSTPETQFLYNNIHRITRTIVKSLVGQE